VSRAGDYSRAMWLRIAAISGALAVSCGAFGAHGLKDRLAPDLLSVWNTAVLYHLVHSLALLALALAAPRRIALPATLFTVGIVVFSGTLYLLALSSARWLGAVTPLGGLALIAGWLSLALPRR
jgi:uncharacterized membrane protein YgdD (TMEM256/DUF423 family)